LTGVVIVSGSVSKANPAPRAINTDIKDDQ